MSSLETTELKLKTTPTGGLEAHTSPYYRRLVSAGYKGYLQGTIGGASLYGTMGAVVGGLAAIPLGIISGAWIGALALIPAGAALGLLKGASTFGQIGSVAAINAESADLSEQRRYLLDMYYDLPDTPDGNARAEAIKQELIARSKDAQKPGHMFHWKTVAVCALIGAVIAGAAVLMLNPTIGVAGAGLVESIGHSLGIPISTELGVALAHLGGVTGLACMGGVIGALAGGTIGLDRYYVRKWFDKTQDVIHSGAHDYGLLERHQQVQRLKEAAVEDVRTKQSMDSSTHLSPEAIAHTAIQKASESSRQQPAVKESEPKGSVTKPVANLDQPATSIATKQARHEGLTTEAIARAMDVPAV